MSAVDPESLRSARTQYESPPFDLPDANLDPVAQWHAWHADVVAADGIEPHAMTLATVDADGAPHARIVLARGVDEQGITFFTNYESAKGAQLQVEPRATVVFGWLNLHRQVRVEGVVQRISAEESDAYFAERPRGSQLGAWASAQSSPIMGRTQLQWLYDATESQYAGGDVPRPPHWGGYRLKPQRWEFWQGQPSRLHDRIVYELFDGRWRLSRLAP